MATITPVASSSNAPLSYQAATASDSLTATAQRVTLMVVNGSGASINVTLAGQNPCNYGATHNVVVAVPAGATEPIAVVGGSTAAAMAGVVSAAGTVTVTYSSITSVTVAATTN
jgi:hypothetical protein